MIDEMRAEIGKPKREAPEKAIDPAIAGESRRDVRPARRRNAHQGQAGQLREGRRGD